MCFYGNDISKNKTGFDCFIFFGHLVLYFVGRILLIPPSSFPVGEIIEDDVYCSSNYYEFTGVFAIDIRQNKNEDFKSVIKCNESGLYRLNNETEFKGVTIIWFHGSCPPFSYRIIRLGLSLHSDKCTLDFDTSASVRCVFFNGSETFHSEEKRIYSIKGIYQFYYLWWFSFKILCPDFNHGSCLKIS